jgi:hypothetical protein
LAEDKRVKDLEATNIQLRKYNLDLQRKLGGFETLLSNLRFRAAIFLAIFIFAAILLSFYPRVLFYANYVFNPTKIPEDYQSVNRYIAKNGGDARIMWVPFIDTAHMYYAWAQEKRLSPFNVWSSNASLNNMQEAYNPDRYFAWLANLFQEDQPSTVQIAEKDLMLQDNIASKLFIPFAARYMVFDSSIKDYKFEGYFDRDRSLKKIFQTPILTVYKPDYNADLIRVANKTVKANTFFDNLAISQKFPIELQGRIAFVNKKPITASFSSVSKKYGLLDINDYLEPVTQNTGFELGNVQDLYSFSWALVGKPPNIRLSKDATTRASGQFSLRVTNTSDNENDIGWVKSYEIPVRPGQIYTFEASVKAHNADLTHAAVEGYSQEKGEWIELVQCPTVDGVMPSWHHYQCSFLVPEGISAIRPALAAGLVKQELEGPAISWFDDVKISRIEEPFYADLIAPFPAPKVIFKKINGEKYLVHVKNASKPFVLVFGEAFDPFWVARTEEGRKIQPAPLYSTINGFQIDERGTFDLTIEFEPQGWYLNGRVISVVVIITCILFIVIDWLLRERTRTAKTSGRGHLDISRVRASIKDYFLLPRRHR